MTITQTVEVPADRRVRFDFEVPREIPEGKVQIELKVVPFVKKEEKPGSNNDEPPLKCLIGVKTPLTDSLLGCIPNPGNKTYDELRFEGMMEKYGEYFK